MSDIVDGKFKDNICQETGTGSFCPLNLQNAVNRGEGLGEVGEHAPMSEYVCDDFETPGAEDSKASCNLSHIRDRSQQEIIDTSTRHTASQFQGARDFTICRSHIQNIGVKNEYYSNHDETYDIPILDKYTSLDAIHDSSAQDPTRQVHPGTRQRVLKCIQEWIDTLSVKERIFWLHGTAGIGKSAIAQTIARTYGREKLPATFFFYRSDPNRNNGNRLFTTLAWQLAMSNPAIRKVLIHSLKERPDIPTKDVEKQFEELIVKPFLTSNVQQLVPVVIIDGVDECSDERLQRRFLKIIGNAVKDNRVPVRFLICSRPEAHIQDTIKIFESLTLSFDLAKLDDANQDIEKYFKDEFNRISTEQDIDSAWPGNQIIDELVYKASGQFIYASTVVKYVEDEYNSAESQLDIIRGLKPYSNTSPFAELDKLYTEILQRESNRDPVFLKDFLSLLMTRIGFKGRKVYYKDDALLMNVSQKELCRKLRGMRSLLKFEPYIEVHHRSFLDFLQDASRSGEYHISKAAAARRYVDLIVKLLVRNTESMIERQNHANDSNDLAHSIISWLLMQRPLQIVLPVEQWQEALQPVLDSWDKLMLSTSYVRQPQRSCRRCRGLWIMRALILHLAFFTRVPDPTCRFALMGVHHAEGSEPMHRTVMPLISNETQMNVLENDLNGCLSSLLTGLRRRKLGTLNADMIQLACFLLRFDHVDIVNKLCSISDAQNLMDLIDELINNVYNDRSSDSSRRVAHLALELHEKIPVLPTSLFLKETDRPKCCDRRYVKTTIAELSKTMLLSKFLDPHYILPVLWIKEQDNHVYLMCDWQGNGYNRPLMDFKSHNPAERIPIMLEIAKIIRYLHSIGLSICSGGDINAYNIILEYEFRPKFHPRLRFYLSIPQYGNAYYLKSDIRSFGRLFRMLFCDFHFPEIDGPENDHVRDFEEDLVRRCDLQELKDRPTIDDIIQEMEAW